MATTRRNHRAITHHLGIGLLALSLAAGGAPTPPGTETPTPGTPVSTTITIDGGNLTAADTNGATLRLTFPPEAVIEPLTITLTPIEDAAQRIDALDLSMWRKIWSLELLDAKSKLDDAVLLDLQDTKPQIEAELLSRLVDRLRVAAFEHCIEDRTQAYLADIRTGGGHAGARLLRTPSHPNGAASRSRNSTATSNTAPTTSTSPSSTTSPSATTTRPAGSAAARSANTTAKPPSTYPAKAYSNSPAPSAHCAANCATPPRFSDDTIALHLDGTEVARWNHTSGNFLAQTRDLALSDILTAAGLPEDATGTFTLTLRRQGEACASAYGDSDTLLYRIVLQVGEVDLAVTRFETEYGVDFNGRPRPASGGQKFLLVHGDGPLDAEAQEATAGSEIDKNGDTVAMSGRASVAVEAAASFGDGPLAFSTRAALSGLATAKVTSDLSADAEADAVVHHTIEFTLGAPARLRIAVEAEATGFAVTDVRLERTPFLGTVAVLQERRVLDTPWSWSYDDTLEPGEYRLRLPAQGYANASCRNTEAADCLTSADAFTASMSATIRIDAAE